MQSSIARPTRRPKKANVALQHLIPNWGVYLIIGLFLVVELFPLLWMVSMSFKQP